jgi:hypothetical protein
LLICAVARAIGTGPKEKADHASFLIYIGLVAILSRLCLLHVPMGSA